LGAFAATSGILAAPLSAGPSAATIPAVVPDQAMRLSEILNPKDKLLEVGARAFDTGFDAALKSDPETVAMLAGNPGLREAILAAGRPIVLKKMEAEIPGQQQRYARFYADKFSPEEMGQLIAFYTTATGAKVIEGMYRGADFAKLAETMGKDEKAGVTPEALGQVSSSAAEKLLPSFDAEDWKALFTFSASPVYAKLNRLTPELQQLAAEIANQPDEAADAAVANAVQAAVKDYMAHKGGTAS
jgi:hypothetical protein